MTLFPKKVISPEILCRPCRLCGWSRSWSPARLEAPEEGRSGIRVDLVAALAAAPIQDVDGLPVMVNGAPTQDDETPIEVLETIVGGETLYTSGS